jgi:hypothetical protein
MKSKKRAVVWSVEFLFKAIFAIIVILLLVYAIGKFVGILKDTPKKDQAKAQFKYIGAIINQLSEGEVYHHIILNPTDWTFFYFSKTNSLCFCYSAEETLLGWRINEKWKWNVETEEFWRKSCDKIGVCQEYKETIDLDIRFLTFNGENKPHPDIDRIWGLRISKPWDFYISKENRKIYFRLFDKSDYEQMMKEILDVISLKLSEEETYAKVNEIRGKAEKEKNMPIVVIIADKSKNIQKFLPDLESGEEIAMENAGNFVFSRDTEDKTKAVYLVLGAKNG